jgi:Mce-associated membrane protein
LLAWVGLALSLVALAVSLLLWVESGRAADRRDGTRAATAAARTAVETMLSYDYKTFDQHTAEVDKLLTGSFRTEFDNGTRQSVRPLAVANQAVVQARASEVGVMSASDNTVRVLAFVNQATTSAKLDRPQVDQNRVILTMSRVDGRWLVSKVEAF